MPFLDGYEANKRIRKLYNGMDIKKDKQPKIIAITGHIEDEYMERALKSGMDKIF